MDEELLAALKALADASRLTIVGLLAKRPHSVDELAAALGLSAPTISHHLSKLAQAGLVEVRAEQYYSIYSLKPKALDGIGKRVMGADRDETLTTLTDEAAYEQTVTKEYVRPSGVTRWPTGLQKQRVLLRWVGANKFQRSLRYSEFQVEDILRQSVDPSPDTNTLRRYMISEKVLARTANGSWYWRADTPEAQRTKFTFEQLALADHAFSPEHFALQLKKGRRSLSFTREVLDTRLRELGAQDVKAMRARMVHLELLLASEDGSRWTVTDPWKMRIMRFAEMEKRLFMVKGKIPALPQDPADRLLVLRCLVDWLDRFTTYDDVQLARIWHYAYADVPGLKRILVDEGLLVEMKDGRVAFPDAPADI